VVLVSDFVGLDTSHPMDSNFLEELVDIVPVDFAESFHDKV
jgi:hypothetical protein